MRKTKIVGQTKDVGFQIGVRRTLSISSDNTWNFLFSETGLNIWLGRIHPDEIELNKNYITQEGIEGKIRVLKPNSHIRLSWKPKHWTNISTLQIRVIPRKDRTTISFHQEKLLGNTQRAEMKNYWSKVIEMLSEKLTETNS